MSFILDALKKSETDRQQQASAEFATVPTGSGQARLPRWLWALAALLIVNLAVLIGLLLRPELEPAMASAPVVQADGVADTSPSFADRVEEARRNAPAIQPQLPEPEAGTVAAATSAPAERPVNAVPALPAAREQTSSATLLPTIHEVRARGTVVIPDLHLDIHVYSEVREDRFVFINMSKQREQSQLDEGPVVQEITPDGVILEYRGTSFLLPRD